MSEADSSTRTASERSDPVTVISIAPPTTNGPLHIGHIAGPFVAGDIAARAARGRGERVVTVGGIDVHPNWVLARAEKEGIEVEKLIMRFQRRIDEALDRARVDCDVYLDARQESHQRALAELASSLAGDAFPMREMTLHACADCGRTLHNAYVAGRCSRCGADATGGTCENCGAFTSAQDLLEAHCGRCGGAPQEFQATVPVLVMEDFHQQLEQIWLRAQYPPRLRDLVAGYLADGLPTLPLAFPTDWGIEGAGELAGLRLDVNFELGLSNYRCAAIGIDPAARGPQALARAWESVDKLWHFHGIDNGFYCAMLWPALYTALGVRIDQIGGAVINEFYTLDGSKFSTSRNHAIWADELLSTEDPEIVRLYLSWDRPDRYRSDFTMAAYEAFRDMVAPMLAGAGAGAGAGAAEGPSGAGQPASGQSTAGAAPLVAADLARGLDALRPAGFDPALATRCLLANLGSGSGSGSGGGSSTGGGGAGHDLAGSGIGAGGDADADAGNVVADAEALRLLRQALTGADGR